MKFSKIGLTRGFKALIIPSFALFGYIRYRNFKTSAYLKMEDEPIKKSKVDILIEEYMNKAPELVRLGLKTNDEAKLQNEHNEEPDNTRIIARSENDYTEHRELYYNYIKYSGMDVVADKKENKLFEKDEIPFMKSVLMNLNSMIDCYVEELDFQIVRNLKGKNFTPSLKIEEREEIKNILVGCIQIYEPDVFKSATDPGNEVYPEEQLYSKGKFFKVNMKHNDYPDKFPKLKEYGVFNDWPNNRVIYKNSGITILINEEDHIKFKIAFDKKKSDQTEKLSTQLLRLYDLLDCIDKTLGYAYHDEFGYLSAIPSNSGNSHSFYMKLKINGANAEKLVQNLKVYSQECNNNYLINSVDDDCTTPDSKNKYLKVINTSSNVSLVQLLLELLQNKESFK